MKTNEVRKIAQKAFMQRVCSKLEYKTSPILYNSVIFDVTYSYNSGMVYFRQLISSVIQRFSIYWCPCTADWIVTGCRN